MPPQDMHRFATRARVSSSLFFPQAFRALTRNKTRSVLAALGITIGIAAVVWVVALGNASTERVQGKLHDLGDNLVWIEAGSRNVAGVRTGTHGTTSLTLEDMQAVWSEIPLIKSISPNVDGSLQIAVGNRNWITRFRGVTPEYLGIRRWSIAEGVMFTDEHVKQSASVAVIGQTVRSRIFGTDPAIGQMIRVQQQPFEVVGVLAPKGQSASGQDQDDTVWMPFSTAQMKIRGKGYEWLDDILCSAVSAEEVVPAIEQINALLRQRHHIEDGDNDDFNIRRPDEVIKAEIATTKTLSMMLIILASISLVIGGIGIMNVMLASVVQRTREIGLRLAVGATPGHVKLQFLGEAIMLSVFGGIAGVLAGVVGSIFLGRFLDWPMSLPGAALVIGPLFSLGVGVFFGLYPAARAARLDPIEALRHE